MTDQAPPPRATPEIQRKALTPEQAAYRDEVSERTARMQEVGVKAPPNNCFGSGKAKTKAGK